MCTWSPFLLPLPSRAGSIGRQHVPPDEWRAEGSLDVQSLGDSHGSGAKAHGGVVTPGVAANNVNNARAIENGLLWMTVIPMILKIITYGVPSHLAKLQTPLQTVAVVACTCSRQRILMGCMLAL